MCYGPMDGSLDRPAEGTLNSPPHRRQTKLRLPYKHTVGLIGYEKPNLHIAAFLKSDRCNAPNTFRRRMLFRFLEKTVMNNSYLSVIKNNLHISFLFLKSRIIFHSIMGNDNRSLTIVSVKTPVPSVAIFPRPSSCAFHFV